MRRSAQTGYLFLVNVSFRPALTVVGYLLESAHILFSKRYYLRSDLDAHQKHQLSSKLMLLVTPKQDRITADEKIDANLNS